MLPSNHLILCHPLLLPPSIFPSVRVFSVLCLRWPKYWSFNFNISPSSEHPGLISFRMDWLDLLAVQGTLKSLLQHRSSKASILQHSAFFYSPTLTSIHVLHLQRKDLIVWNDLVEIMHLPFLQTFIWSFPKIFIASLKQKANSWGTSITSFPVHKSSWQLPCWMHSLKASIVKLHWPPLRSSPFIAYQKIKSQYGLRFSLLIPLGTYESEATENGETFLKSAFMQSVITHAPGHQSHTSLSLHPASPVTVTFSPLPLHSH